MTEKKKAKLVISKMLHDNIVECSNQLDNKYGPILLGAPKYTDNIIKHAEIHPDDDHAKRGMDLITAYESFENIVIGVNEKIPKYEETLSDEAETCCWCCFCCCIHIFKRIMGLTCIFS